jgi:hypothetical protein
MTPGTPDAKTDSRAHRQWALGKVRIMQTTLTPEPVSRPVRPHRRRHPRFGPRRSRGWGRFLIVLGLLTLISGGFLVAMFVAMGFGHGPAPWGPVNDSLTALSNLMLAAAIPMLSRRAERREWEQSLVRLAAAASVVSAVSGVLLVTNQLAFEVSTAISLAAILLQMLWLLWLSHRYAADPDVPAGIHLYGTTVAVALLAGLALAAASFAFPGGSLAAEALLIPGLAGGGVAWLAWPAWYLLVGRYLSRAPADGLMLR